MASRRRLQLLLLACASHIAAAGVLRPVALRSSDDNSLRRGSGDDRSGRATLVARQPWLPPRAPVTRALLYANCAAFLLTARRPGLMQQLAKAVLELISMGGYYNRRKN